MRTTRAEVDATFRNFCTQSGLRAATSWNDVGGLQLDYNSAYGGFVVQRIENESGGVSCPFGHGRLPHGAMADTFRFASAAFYERAKK
jgi:hypothetical protein